MDKAEYFHFFFETKEKKKKNQAKHGTKEKVKEIKRIN
jgi:hypothetical protein